MSEGTSSKLRQHQRRYGNRQLCFSFMLALIFSLIQLVSSEITGSIAFDGSGMIQAAGAKYRFSIQGANNFQRSGKVLIVFPANFIFPLSTFSSPQSLACINLDDSNKQLDCSFKAEARLLVMRINSTTHPEQKTFQFTVAGMTNPDYAIETDPFTIQNYYIDSSGQQQYEPSGDRIKLTPTSGSLSQVTLTPDDSTVSALTSLQVSFKLQHSLPSLGQIIIQMPKWNPFASSQSQMLSFIQASTSPGQVPCTPVLGLSQTESLTCMFTSGTATDTLVVMIGQTSVAAGQSLAFSLDSFRMPPYQKLISGIQVSTGGPQAQLIDQGTTTLIATQPFTLTSSSVRISEASSTRINSLTSITLEIKNSNPIAQGATFQIMIPSELKSDQLSSVTARGGSAQSNPAFTLSTNGQGQTVVTLNGLNTAYIEPSTYHYITLSQLKVPSTTKQTSSFTVQIIEPSTGTVIEQITVGIAFRPTVGGITSASIVTNGTTQNYIDQPNVWYKFTFKPEDNFVAAGAVLKITFPDQVLIDNRINAKLPIKGTFLPVNMISQSSAKVTVTQNKYAVITQLFSKDYTAGTELQITIDGITNPSTTSTTDSFKVQIFYTEGLEEVSMLDSGLTFQAIANPNLGFQVLLRSSETGVNNNLQFVISTPTSTTGRLFEITKGSYLKIGIPVDFQIYDASIATSTCLKSTGFPDEVSCSLEISTSGLSTAHHILTVKNGFDSRSFPGGSLAFNISEIRNPFTSKETGTFTVQVYSPTDSLLYEYSGPSVTEIMKPAPFLYAMVSSSSPITGDSSLYTFTMTLSVDTDVNTQFIVTPPKDIVYDQSKQFACKGLLNLSQKQLRCENRNNGMQFFVQVWSDQSRTTYISNGTTVSFQLGYFFNPLSLEVSDSFKVSTFQTSLSNTKYYYINQEEKSLTVQNAVKGPLRNLSISQIGQNTTELNFKTSLNLTFKTTALITEPIIIAITLPQNIIVNISSISFKSQVNGQFVATAYNQDSKTMSMQIQSPPANQNYEIIVFEGLQNPSIGPYSYENFIIDVQNIRGYSINGIQANKGFNISVSCTNNCLTCQGYLNNCTSCGFNAKTNTTYFLESKSNARSTCLSECPKGKYSDSSDFQCKACQYPCLECKFGPQLCTKCFSNHTLPYASEQTLSCYKECPVGTYLDLNQQLCIACKYPCFTCSSAEQCLSCVVPTSSPINPFNYYSKEMKCYQQCPDGTLATAGQQCIECLSPCKTCAEAPDQCTSCQLDYFLHMNSICVSSCPSGYISKKETMTCFAEGEMTFPFPFSIVAGVIILGLLVANFMKNQTEFFISLIAFNDIVLKLNWCFLLPYLVVGGYLIASFIIAFSLFANFVINFIIWRISLRNQGILTKDQAYQVYSHKFPCLSSFHRLGSYLFSFHMF